MKKFLVYNARVREKYVACFTHVHPTCPFDTKTQDVRHQNARRPSSKRKTSVVATSDVRQLGAFINSRSLVQKVEVGEIK